ncbi:MAG: lysophospholipid acyltransferase family protein [Actinomycetes bacterium]
MTNRAAVRARRGRRGFWYAFAAGLLRPLLMALTRRDWRGGEHLPDGGAVVVVNHVSHIDPLVFAHFLYDHGRLPRFLGKEVLFRVPFVGRVLRGAGQIPVFRESGNAADAYSAAVEAVRRGELVAFYPEATLTRDPGLWPMVGKTGAARVALETGAPVIPVAQWGPHVLLPPYAKRPHLLPRTTMHVWAGPPIDLSDLTGRKVDAAVLREVTERIMAAITGLLEEIRGEKAPAVRFDPRQSGLPRTGNPRRGDRRPA